LEKITHDVGQRGARFGVGRTGDWIEARGPQKLDGLEVPSGHRFEARRAGVMSVVDGTRKKVGTADQQSAWT